VGYDIASPWRDEWVDTLIVARETALVHTLGRFMPPELFRSTPFSDSSRRLNCEEIAESTDLKNTNEAGPWPIRSTRRCRNWPPSTTCRSSRRRPAKEMPPKG